MGLQKQKKGTQAWVRDAKEEKGGETQSIRQTQPAIVALNMDRGPQAKEYEWPLEARNSPEGTANKEIGTTFPQPQRFEFCQLEGATREISPRGSWTQSG